MALKWYVLRTEPKAEYMASTEFQADGFEVYFPRVNTPHNRIGHGDSPLFPGYLFIRCDPQSDGWPSLRMKHRISGWVNFAGIVPPVPDEVIAELVQRVDGINGTNGLWRRFRKGEQVRVVSRGLDGLGEVIEEAKSPQARARVLLHFMGGLVQAQVPWVDLQPVRDHITEKQRLPRRTRGKGRWIQGFGPAVPFGA